MKIKFCSTILIIILILGLPATFIGAQEIRLKEVEQLDFANGIFKRSLYAMAASEYEKFIKEFPESQYIDEAYFGLAESLFFKKSYQESVEKYLAYIQNFENGGKSFLCKLRIGQAYHYLKDYEKAALYFGNLDIQKMDQSFHATYYFYYAKTLLFNKQYDKSIKNFHQAIKKDQNNKFKAHAYLSLGDIFASKKEVEKAVENYDLANKNARDPQIKIASIYKQGEVYFLSQNYDQGISKFSEIVNSYPQDDLVPKAMTNLLISLFNVNRYAEVVSTFESKQDLIHEQPQYFDAFFTTAKAYFQNEQYDKAIEMLDRVLFIPKLDKNQIERAIVKKMEIFVKAKKYNNVLVLFDTDSENVIGRKDYMIYLKAESYYGLSRHEEAVEAYKQVINDYPQSDYVGDSKYSLAYAYNIKGDSKEAREMFLKYYTEEKNTFKRQRSLYNTILIEIKQKLIDEAIDHCNEYLTVYENQSQTEDVLYMLGVLYSQAEKHAEAVGSFEKFLSKYSNSDHTNEIYYLLGYSKQIQKSYDEALEAYMMIAPSDDENDYYYSALKNSGSIHLQNNKEYEAIDIFDRLISEFPKNDLDAEIYLLVAEKYMDLERYDDTLRILVDLDRRDIEETQKAKSYYLKGKAHQFNKNYNQAIGFFDRVLENEKWGGFWGVSRLGKGVCLLHQNEFNKARLEMERAIEENPNDDTIALHARFQLGELEQKANNFDKATKYYMLVVILYPENDFAPKALYKAGQLFELQSKNKEALEAYQEINNKYQNSSYYEKAVERIKTLSD